MRTNALRIRVGKDQIGVATALDRGAKGRLFAPLATRTLVIDIAQLRILRRPSPENSSTVILAVIQNNEHFILGIILMQ